METIIALVTHPQFAAFILAGLVPFLFRTLKEAGFPIEGRAKVLTNLVLSVVVSFIPLVATWAASGVPDDPEAIFAAATAAFTSSTLLYHLTKERASKPEEVSVS